MGNSNNKHSFNYERNKFSPGYTSTTMDNITMEDLESHISDIKKIDRTVDRFADREEIIAAIRESQTLSRPVDVDTVETLPTDMDDIDIEEALNIVQNDPPIVDVTNTIVETDIEIDQPPPVVDECPPEKIMNPASGRCVLRTGVTGKKLLKAAGGGGAAAPAAARVVECPPEKIMNPASGRCVLRTGALGKKIIKAAGGGGAAAPAAPRMVECPPEKIMNPASGRCVLRTGVTGKKILKAAGD